MSKVKVIEVEGIKLDKKATYLIIGSMYTAPKNDFIEISNALRNRGIDNIAWAVKDISAIKVYEMAPRGIIERLKLRKRLLRHYRPQLPQVKRRPQAKSRQGVPMSNYIKVEIQAKSINQLVKENPELVYKQDWYVNEKWAKAKPKAETLWICPQIEGSVNKTWDEQQVGNGDPYLKVPTVNQLIQCLIAHYKATGERLLETSWSRTSDVDSDGDRVDVGIFGADGLNVDDDWYDRRYDYLGVASSRKSDPLKLETLDPLDNLNIGITEITVNGKRYRVVENE